MMRLAVTAVRLCARHDEQIRRGPLATRRGVELRPGAGLIARKPAPSALFPTCTEVVTESILGLRVLESAK